MPRLNVTVSSHFSDDSPPPTTFLGMPFLFFAQVHPRQKKKIPLQIDMHLPASALIHEVARATRIPLEKLSVEYGGWLWPQDGLNHSCRDNYIREGTCLVAVSIGQGKKWRKGRETPRGPSFLTSAFCIGCSTLHRIDLFPPTSSHPCFSFSPVIFPHARS